MSSTFGQLVMARRRLEPAGRWQALLDDVRRLLTDRSTPAEYLVTVGRTDRYGR